MRWREARAGALYVASTFAVGALAGPVREGVLVPLVGETAALLMEAPVMIAAMVLIAAHLVVRLAVPPQPRARLLMGMIALLLLLVLELVLSALLRDMTPGQWIARFRSDEGRISAVLYALFALVPLALLYRRRERFK